MDKKWKILKKTAFKFEALEKGLEMTWRISIFGLII
jgi:hypothetical protein